MKRERREEKKNKNTHTKKKVHKMILWTKTIGWE